MRTTDTSENVIRTTKLVLRKGCYHAKFIYGGLRVANLTAEQCFKECNWEGVVGLYSTMCICERQLWNLTRQSSSLCSLTCQGNTQQTCGGIRTISIYQQSSRAIRWAIGHPMQNDGCAYMRKIDDSDVIFWYSAQCETSMRFLCQFENNSVCGDSFRCIRPLRLTESWEGARSACARWNGSLATITIPISNSDSDITSLTPGRYWVGLKRQYEWRWGDGCGNCQNCKSQRMMDMMKALSESIGREIHDVLPDGNCMFRSIIDQLRMQGELDWTAMSLRTKAVEYLRENPHQDDGTHLAEFLPFDGDTWLEYLKRMSKDTEWGDNIILRGLAEVIGRNICIISAFGDLHNQTTVSPSVKRDTTESDDVFLGHINDQHYVSLRRKDWKESWFKCAKIIQLRQNIPEVCRSDGIESDMRAMEIRSTMDKYSKVPLCHLNFLLRHTIPEKSIVTVPKEFVQGMLQQSSKKRVKTMLYGSEVDGLAVFSIKGTLSTSMNKPKRKSSGLPNCAFFYESMEPVVQFENDGIESLNQFEMHFDGHHPGYLRLHCPAFGELYPEFVKETKRGVCLLKRQYKDNVSMSYVYGFKCKEWPAFLISNWVDRNRPSGWPDEDLKEILLSQYIAIVPFSHPESEDRDIEWQMCFAKQEYTLAMSLNSHKKYCFHIYQLLVRYFVGEEPLKRYFLKNIFFRALENISVENWEFSPGACILYLIEQTIYAINTKHLEHYFVSNNNLIDWLTDDSCRILSEKLEAVRKFPVTAILLLAEGYGLTTSWVADLVIEDIPRFRQHGDLRISTMEVFVPAYIKESHEEVHLHYYGRAVKIFWESFTEISRGCVADVLSFNDFLRQNLQDLGSSDQWWFCFFLDYYYSRGSLQEMFQHYEGIHLYEIVGETEDPGIFGNIKIPYQLLKENGQSESHRYKSSLSTHISFLRTLCNELNRDGIYDHSVFYFRILIRKIKENIVSYRYSQDQVENDDNEAMGRFETDEMQTAFNSLKKTRRENYYLKETIAIQLNVELFYTYIHMFNTYQELGQPELFSEYMEDLESVCYTIATKHAYKQLAHIWWILGVREKYKEAMDRYSS
ncbi:hypothetical protein FSP39_011340 [Pinctada imbricata]|uniref:OTU domain-containing protein n=1 Tax=Pinctada imbricata TaxID=66713 RepID=A0AA89CDA4_PINIB|nr:hypothetical protein FSP39_011340 [Pinctada imbricata]